MTVKRYSCMGEVPCFPGYMVSTYDYDALAARLAEAEALLERAMKCLGDNDDEDVLARAIYRHLSSERHINADSASHRENDA